MLKNIYLLFICTILLTGLVLAGSLNMNAYSLNVKGDNNNNNLIGTSDNDRLDGKNGNDILFGDLGADSFKCGGGIDTIKDFNSAEGDKKSSDCEKTGYNRDSSNGGIHAKFGIDQVQSNVQNIKCEIKGFIGIIDDSCFNSNSQNLANKGNIALAQDGGNGKGGNSQGDGDGDGDDGSGGGNSADPEISQAQSNIQNVQCVSGEDAIVSCNNVSFQNQINEGNIALGQIY